MTLRKTKNLCPLKLKNSRTIVLDGSRQVLVKVVLFQLQGDSSKIGQTLRLKPCFNTVPIHFFFKLLCLSVVQANYCTGDHSNLKKSWEGTVLKQGFNLNVCPILEESPCNPPEMSLLTTSFLLKNFLPEGHL